MLSCRKEILIEKLNKTLSSLGIKTRSSWSWPDRMDLYPRKVGESFLRLSLCSLAQHRCKTSLSKIESRVFPMSPTPTARMQIVPPPNIEFKPLCKSNCLINCTKSVFNFIPCRYLARSIDLSKWFSSRYYMMSLILGRIW